MNGFLNINKPAGITSFDVIRKLTRLQSKTKMGHLGTLDPMATGVLPVAVGNGTRLIEYIEDRTKIYNARMVLGAVSDTQDAAGNITLMETIEVAPDFIIDTAKSFIGTISQTPPMYSAVHHQGKRLYELARKGQTVEIKARQVNIQAIDHIRISINPSGFTQVSFEVKCSEGTYIRTLCHDIGQKLGTGAYMDSLTRTQSGVFGINESYSLETVAENGMASYLKPLEYPICQMPVTNLDTEDYEKVCHGISIESMTKWPEGLIRLNYQGKLTAIAKCYWQGKYILKPLKVLNQR